MQIPDKVRVRRNDLRNPISERNRPVIVTGHQSLLLQSLLYSMGAIERTR
jgi:hypothetical protein